MRSLELSPPPSQPMTISRDIGGRRYYLSAGPHDMPRGTFDRSKALKFRTFKESRDWTEALPAIVRWALFVAGEYRLDLRSTDERPSGRDESRPDRLTRVARLYGTTSDRSEAWRTKKTDRPSIPPVVPASFGAIVRFFGLDRDALRSHLGEHIFDQSLQRTKLDSASVREILRKAARDKGWAAGAQFRFEDSRPIAFVSRMQRLDRRAQSEINRVANFCSMRCLIIGSGTQQWALIAAKDAAIPEFDEIDSILLDAGLVELANCDR